VNGMPFSKLRRKRKKYNNVIAETIDIIECCTYILSSEILYGLKRHFFLAAISISKSKKTESKHQKLVSTSIYSLVPYIHTYIHILQTLQTLDVVIFNWSPRLSASVDFYFNFVGPLEMFLVRIELCPNSC
jgi:hypothetical protein